MASVVDPEALLLLSCTLRTGERRLDDVLAWWANAGAALLSVQRVRTMLRDFPQPARAGLAAFARAAMAGGDARWKPLGAEGTADDLISRGKRGREPRLVDYPALMLRLRAAFGVGVKADVLSVLIAMGGADATVRELVRATGYTAAAVRRAAGEMQAARVVRGTSGRPAAYHADSRTWVPFLGLGVERGGWRHFAAVFAFLADAIAWGTAEGGDGYVAASTARDVFEARRFAFEANRIPFVEPNDAPGAGYLDAFATSVHALGSWLSSHL